MDIALLSLICGPYVDPQLLQPAAERLFVISGSGVALCVPNCRGTVVNLPGYFRLSLTANDAMIEKSIPGFAAAFAAANAQ